MSSETIRKDLYELIQRLLTDLRRLEGLELLGSDDAVAAGRLIEIEDLGSAYRAHLASDELGLEQKLLLEQTIKSRLAELSPGLDLRLNFKRRRSLAARIGDSAVPSTQEIPVQTGPFGVRRKTRAIPGVKKIIAVSSGKGGVGKSTISVNLAAGLAMRGQQVGLLDADLYGPSAPLLMGLEGPMPISASQKMLPLESFGVKVVSFGFMSDPYHPVIWRGPMVAKALEQLFYQVEWGELDYLVIDLPPGTGDVQLTMIESLPIHGSIIVSTPQAVALLDAHKGLSMFEKLRVPVLGLVENMSHFQCSSCSYTDDVFGQAQIETFARERQVPILARIPLHRVIREASDQGIPLVHVAPDLGRAFFPLVDTILEAAM